MANFLYFLPGEAAVNEAVLEKYGLSDRFRSGYEWRGCTPAEKDGQLCVPGTNGAVDIEGTLVGLGTASDVRFRASDQIWERVEEPGRPVWHLGYYRESPPKEADLQRAFLLDGYSIELGNGERWSLPPVRRHPEGTGLPSRLKLKADGGVEQELMDEYRALFDEVSDYAETYYGGLLKAETGEAGEPPDFPLAVAYKLIAVNYRVGRAEINALGLVTSENLPMNAWVAIDLPAFYRVAGDEQSVSEAEKKGASSDSPVLSAGG